MKTKDIVVRTEKIVYGSEPVTVEETPYGAIVKVFGYQGVRLKLVDLLRLEFEQDPIRVLHMSKSPISTITVCMEIKNDGEHSKHFHKRVNTKRERHQCERKRSEK